jgi:hypothetical protein
MKFLQKTWIRVIISLFGGGMISEIIHISTGDPNRPTNPGSNTFIVLSAAVIIYFLLTNLSKKQN